MSAYVARLIGGVVGMLIITYFVSRLLHRYAFKAQLPIKKAVFVSLATLGLFMVLGSLGFGPVRAFLIYAPGVVVWLIVDLVRARRASISEPPSA